MAFDDMGTHQREISGISVDLAGGAGRPHAYGPTPARMACGGQVLRLHTFGGLSLTRDGHAVFEASTRLHGLASLARIAAAGDRGVSRDKLLGCFWPERDERHARHALSQMLYDLRRAVGDGDFLRGG
jgi:hypothetical protein